MARTLLIVDDHAGFRATVRTVLAGDGFEVVGEAEDGTSALAAVERLQPDVVLLDVQLPDMNGFEVAAQLCKQNGSGPQVVLTSSRDATDFGPLVPGCGARGFIPKAELSGAVLQAVLR